MSGHKSPVEAIYCLGCNRRYRMRHAGERCPRCGMSPSVQQISHFAETICIPLELLAPIDPGRPEEERDIENSTEPMDGVAKWNPEIAEGERERNRGGRGDGTFALHPGHQETLIEEESSPDDEGEQEGEAEESLVGRSVSVYQCESMIGRGGMGRVYLARHQRLNRLCALKILSLRTRAIDADYIARFHEEGQTVAALSHPNIVMVHAQGEEEGLHYLEMEYVPGSSLQQLLTAEGRFPYLRATSLIACVADGLAAAHRGNVLHRDLKLDNILLAHSGVPKIVDFGLAKRVRTKEASQNNERLVGTPNYMAPELLFGQPATPASDIYAIGVCWFFLITGRLPLVGRTLGELQQLAAERVPPLVSELVPEVPNHIAEAIAGMLAKSPCERPTDGQAAWRILTELLSRERGLDDLVQASFRIHPVDLHRHGAGYRVVVSLPMGRRQTVFIELIEQGSASRLVEICSLCGMATSALYETALRLNSEMAHGAIAVRDVGGKPMFVTLNTYPLATADPEEIRVSVLEIAARADALEKILSDHDRH